MTSTAIRATWSSLLSKNFHSPLNQTRSTSQRSLFYWITLMFNRVDARRLKEVGPDRACAEWLLKNGAVVVWKENGEFISDYNALPSLEESTKHIRAVDATNSAISDIGFPHFNGCNYIDEIKLVNCVYLQDPAISLLSVLEKSLNYLEIRSCLNISGKALLDADKLTNLKTLKVGNMSHIKNKTEIIEKLTKALPDCKIDFE